MRGLRYLKPAYSFRAGYAYDNTLYIVAGQVAAAAGGAPYPTLMRREVFQPLGMSRCQIGTWNRDEVGNVARPHILENGRYVEEPASGPIVHALAMDAAGGVRCSLNDMLNLGDELAGADPEAAGLAVAGANGGRSGPAIRRCRYPRSGMHGMAPSFTAMVMAGASPM